MHCKAAHKTSPRPCWLTAVALAVPPDSAPYTVFARTTQKQSRVPPPSSSLNRAEKHGTYANQYN